MRVLDLVRSMKTVVDLPNFGDERATREWLLGVISTAWALPGDSLDGMIDDDTVQFLSAAASSERMFEPIYRLMLVVLTTSRALTAEEAALAVRQLEASAKTAGVNPLAVLRVVEDIADLVRLIQQ